MTVDVSSANRSVCAELVLHCRIGLFDVGTAEVGREYDERRRRSPSPAGKRSQAIRVGNRWIRIVKCRTNSHQERPADRV